MCDKRLPLVVADAAVPYIDGRLNGMCRLVRLPYAQIDREALREADAAIVRTRTRCDKALLEGSRVSFIATATIGIDHINAADMSELGIEWCNAPGCNAPAVAQYVWSSILRLGFDPQRHTLGIVGCGHVGSIVAEWGRSLGAEILVSDPPLQRSGCTDLPFAPLEELLRRCDAVTLHTPYTKQGPDATHHLISDPQIESMRPGAILVNAARGPVTRTAPLADALEQGRIKGVIDCWEGEPLIDRRLLRFADVATCHIAGYSVEGKQRATRMALAALGRHFGFTPDLSGLAAPYEPGNRFTARDIMESFDPSDVCRSLRSNPADFERIRTEYKLRRETAAIDQ